MAYRDGVVASNGADVASLCYFVPQKGYFAD